MIAFYQGNWDQARTGLQDAEAITCQNDVSHIFLAQSQVLLALAEGKRDEASQLLEDQASRAERTDRRLLLHWAQPLLAACDLVEGRADVARARLAPLLDHPGSSGFYGHSLPPVLAWVHLELGELAEAEQVVADAIVRMRADNNQLDLVDALRVQALVAIRQACWAEAEVALEEGLSLARSMPYRYAEARLLHVYGELHAAKGEPQLARERLAAALAILRQLGARKDAERVEQALRTLPSVPLPDAPGPARPSRPTGQVSWPVHWRAGAWRGGTGTRGRWSTCAPPARSVRAYATALAVSVDTALLDLRDLVARGLVRAEGRTKNRRYVLTGHDQP